jgi:hypothetical protein
MNWLLVYLCVEAASWAVQMWCGWAFLPQVLKLEEVVWRTYHSSSTSLGVQPAAAALVV